MQTTRSVIIFCVILSFTYSWNNIYAQITIGSHDAPQAGALLDLKEHSNTGGFNASRGMLLPRVGLTHVDKLLMSGEEIKNTDDGGNQYKKHTGLVVYNINHFCNEESELYYPGLYVWDGEKWIPIGDQSYNPNSNPVWVTTDQEGKTFRAARFGNAGIWMIDNLAVTSYASESGSSTNYLPTSPGNSISFQDPKWAYPGPNPDPLGGATNGTNPYYYNNFREYGLLYNWIAATGGQSRAYNPTNLNSTLDQGRTTDDTPGVNEVENYEAKGYIQGICPNGWHLPSDREWSMLEREIFYNPEKYSYISQAEQATWQPNTWQSEWDEFIQYTPLSIYQSWHAQNANPENSLSSNLSLAMKRPCMLNNQIDDQRDVFKRGRSFFPQDGGFNIIPAGDITAMGTRLYGDFAYYWSSSYKGYNPSDSRHRIAMTRAFSFNPNSTPDLGDMTGATSNGRHNISDYKSVRCIYHGNSAPI